MPTARDAAQAATWTVRELLAWTTERFARAGLDSPRGDALHLLAQALGCSRIDLYVRHDDIPDEPGLDRFRDYVRRRLTREPVAYIEGRRGFHALDLELLVDRNVLIPRPETEHLVDWVLEELRPPPAPPLHVLDVGTGCGAIAFAIKHARKDVNVVGADLSDEVLAVARANADALGLEVRLLCSDLLGCVPPPEGGWTAIAANLPYVPTADLAEAQPEVRDYEPRLALDGGEDGLERIRGLVRAAGEAGVLAPGAGLYLEVGIGQADAVAELMRRAGYEDVEQRDDLSGVPRVVRGLSRGDRGQT
jgi:release factor glutamine methyltransferase